VLDAIGKRFDRWLTRVGKENRPTDAEHDIYPEEELCKEKSSMKILGFSFDIIKR